MIEKRARKTNLTTFMLV